MGAACLAFLLLLPPLFGKVPAVTVSKVEQSLCALNPDGSAGILVGGDSRAVYHVIPAIIEEETGKSTVNLAQWIHLSGDPVSLVNALRKHPEALASGPVIVLSVTLDVANDFAFKGVPLAAFLNWGLADHIRLAMARQKAYPRFMFGTVLPSLAAMSKHLITGEGFRCGPDVRHPPGVLAQKGFYAYEGKKKTGFYTLPSLAEDYRLDGGNWKALQGALDWLEASPARRIVLLSAPIHSEWLRSTDGPVAMEMEDRFADQLAAEAARRSKTVLWDYYREPLPELTLVHYYDQLHLNREGAEIFSRHLGRRLAALDSSARP